MESDLSKQLEKFWDEIDGHAYGGLLVFLPTEKQFVQISYGSGDNLSSEDYDEGYDDYVYISVTEFDGSWNEDVDGGMLMLKMQKDYNGHYNVCQHVKDALEMVYETVPEVIVLQSFIH